MLEGTSTGVLLLRWMPKEIKGEGNCDSTAEGGRRAATGCWRWPEGRAISMDGFIRS